MMKKALVLGASGSMGASITFELLKRGFQVVAFARNKEKLEALFTTHPEVSIFSGDGFRVDDLMKATAGIDIIFHAANIPYPEWSEKHPQLLKNVLLAAKQASAKVVMIDNIYAYGRNPGHPINEAHPKQPHTRKGKIRLQMEQLVKAAHSEETPALIAHFPDFYGPYGGNTILHVLLEPISRQKKGIFVGSMENAREYIYLPDGSKAVVELAHHEDAYGQNWNIPGAGVISGEEILRISDKILKRKNRAFSVGKVTISLMGLFNPMMRELVEMLYLTDDPIVLDGSKYEREIGAVPRTPYEIGIAETLRHMSNVQY